MNAKARIPKPIFNFPTEKLKECFLPLFFSYSLHKQCCLRNIVLWRCRCWTDEVWWGLLFSLFFSTGKIKLLFYSLATTHRISFLQFTDKIFGPSFISYRWILFGMLKKIYSAVMYFYPLHFFFAQKQERFLSMFVYFVTYNTKATQ